MVGGMGDDTYVVDNTADRITEDSLGGVDAVQTSVSYTLGVFVENLTLTGTGAISGTGNDGNNLIVGNSAANTINGAAGADVLRGGAGDDTYIIDAAGALGGDRVITVITDSIEEAANAGIDSVYSSVGYTLPENVENLYLTDPGRNAWEVLHSQLVYQLWYTETEYRRWQYIDGFGNGLDNVITGGLRDNWLDAGSGNDNVYGAGGNDYIFGGAGNDKLYGGAGNDNLNGGDGNDYLDGGEGADWTGGGTGDDTYVVDNVGDVVGSDSQGLNTVLSSVSYTADSGIAKLVLTGSAAINATGTYGDQTLIGNAAANVLTAGKGAVTLNGGGGDDTYFVAYNSYTEGTNYDPADTVIEGANAGFDTVYAYGDFAMPANVEKLVITEGIATGGSADDYIVGSWSSEKLIGSAGNDLLNGGIDGADTLFGDSGNDVLEGLAGNDIISDTAGNNVFNGGLGDDAVTGNTGRELFIGGKSNDTITTGIGADLIAFNRGDGQDLLKASTGRDNTLSIGGGIRYADMSFTKSSTDLVLNLGGTGEKITLQGWYDTAADYKSIVNMQVIVDAMADFNAASPDKLVNKKIANFDFMGLAAAYDGAGAPVNWALTNALLSKHLSGSDTAALGGDLAYRYGKTGALTGMGFDAAQGLLTDASFATAAQTLQSATALDAGVKRLS
jgi:Ca2+-binding RTX toxin-like protein